VRGEASWGVFWSAGFSEVLTFRSWVLRVKDINTKPYLKKIEKK
jgi:hypothetical protein